PTPPGGSAWSRPSFRATAERRRPWTPCGTTSGRCSVATRLRGSWCWSSRCREPRWASCDVPDLACRTPSQRRMIPAMAEPPDELGAQGADQPDLDPEDAPVELDEEGFLVSSGRRWQFPTDLDVWVRWAAAVVVGVAAFETLAYLISGSLSGWGTGIGNVPLPRPEGYYSLLLLAGVL